MSTQYDNWIFSQIEPDSILIIGKAKREPKKVTEIFTWNDRKYSSANQLLIEEQKENARQDAYLLKHGIK